MEYFSVWNAPPLPGLLGNPFWCPGRDDTKIHPFMVLSEIVPYADLGVLPS